MQPIHDTVNRFIAVYTPQIPAPHWQPIAEFVRDAAREAGFDTFNQIRRTLINTTAFVRWAVATCGLPLERDEIFTADLVEEFTRTLSPKYSPRAIEQTRLSLLKLTVTLTGDASRVQGRSTNDRRRPYTSAELAHFRSWAGGQPTVQQRHNTLTLLTLGVGCGLRPPEIRNARTADLRLDTDTPGIHVHGDWPRFVPVLSTWTEELRQVANGCTTDWLFTSNGNRDTGANLRDFLHNTSGIGVRPTPSRLRATWIVAHLNSGTHVPAMLRASGLTSLGSLDGYLPWVNPRGDHDDQVDLGQAVAA